MNYAIVFRLLGYVLMIEGALLLLPAAASRKGVTGENSIIAHSKNPVSLFFIFTASFPYGRSAVFSGTEPQSRRQPQISRRL